MKKVRRRHQKLCFQRHNQQNLLGRIIIVYRTGSHISGFRNGGNGRLIKSLSGEQFLRCLQNPSFRCFLFSFPSSLRPFIHVNFHLILNLNPLIFERIHN